MLNTIVFGVCVYVKYAFTFWHVSLKWKGNWTLIYNWCAFYHFSDQVLLTVALRGNTYFAHTDISVQ